MPHIRYQMAEDTARYPIFFTKSESILKLVEHGVAKTKAAAKTLVEGINADGIKIPLCGTLIKVDEEARRALRERDYRISHVIAHTCIKCGGEKESSGWACDTCVQEWREHIFTPNGDGVLWLVRGFLDWSITKISSGYIRNIAKWGMMKKPPSKKLLMNTAKKAR